MRQENVFKEYWIDINATKFTMETPQISGAKTKLYQYQRRETFGKESTSKGIWLYLQGKMLELLRV